MRFILFFILSLSICCTLNKSNKPKLAQELNCHQKYSAIELKEDFKLLTESLKEAHPDLYRVSSKEQLAIKIEEINSSLSDSLNYLQFLKLIAPLFTNIGCINTQWGHSKDFITYRNKNIKLFPLEFKIEMNQFTITKNWSSNKSLKKGEKIIELNGETVTDYLEKNYKLLPIDGKIRTLQDRWLESYFPNHHANFWEQPDTFFLKIKLLNDSTTFKKVAARFKNEIELEKKKEPLIPSQPLQFKIIDSVAFLTIKTFNSNYITAKNQELHHFLDSSFSVLKNDKMPLVIDLRNNAWGNLKHGAELLEYLSNSEFQYIVEPSKKGNSGKQMHISDLPYDTSLVQSMYKFRIPQKNSYLGHLYVLTNGWNVNAGGLFCARLSKREKTSFVGEKPGSTLFGINCMPTHLILPNTKIGVSIPTKQLIIAQGNPSDLEGIKTTPQTEIPPSIGKAISKYKRAN